jgi:hypothetical protein
MKCEGRTQEMAETIAPGGIRLRRLRKVAFPASRRLDTPVRRYLPAIVSLVLPLAASSQVLSPLAEPPQWSDIEAMQESVTREEFERLLREVYAPKGCGAWPDRDLSRSRNHRAAVRATGASDAAVCERCRVGSSSGRVIGGLGRKLGSRQRGKPFSGMRIALDPGHLGGEWARMEGRWFQIGAETSP